MADNIVVSYKAVPEGFDKVNASVKSVTNETKTLQKQIQQTFSDKSIEEATLALYEQGDVMGALITRYGDASKAMKAMDKELATMAALGQTNTKEYKELVKIAGQLKNAVGDTSNEIKKLASSTRTIDTVSQGVRGMAAAFSVVAGTAAQFGVENKELEKTMLRVQGAMTTLQGVQELANLATEKGGIATKAYSVALEVVDKISKTTGLSIAASWAVATAGISILIGGIVLLIDSMNDVETETKETTAALKAQREETDNLIDSYKNLIGETSDLEYELSKIDKEFDKAIEKLREEAVKKSDDDSQNLFTAIYGAANPMAAAQQTFEIEQARQEALKRIEPQIQELERQRQIKRAAVRAKELDRLAEEEATENVKRDKRIYEARRQNALLAIEQLKQMRMDEEDFWEENVMGISVDKGLAKLKKSFDENKIEEPLITEASVNAAQVNADRQADLMAINLQLAKKNFDDTKAYEAKVLAERRKLNEDYFGAVQKGLGAVSSFAVAVFEQQQMTLDTQRERDLIRAGEDAKKKEKIEKDYAIKKAKVVRDQAILEKSLAVFQIGIDTAKSIMAISADSTIPLPAKPAFYALAAATAALQLGAVLAKPLPQIPKFDEGGPVAKAGGRIDSGYLQGRSHRDGGILIEAEGGEYIWDRESTKKHGDIIRAAHENRIEDLILHKYVVPMMREKSRMTNETYDDWLLRSVIKQGQKLERKNAEFIAAKVSETVSTAIYNQNRYR